MVGDTTLMAGCFGVSATGVGLAVGAAYVAWTADQFVAHTGEFITGQERETYIHRAAIGDNEADRFVADIVPGVLFANPAGLERTLAKQLGAGRGLVAAPVSAMPLLSKGDALRARGGLRMQRRLRTLSMV